MTRKKIKTKTDQRPFIIVYHDFLESDVLDTHYQKLLYIYLKKFADSNNQCFPSLKILSNLTKIGKTKVKETLKELENKGVLVVESRNKDNGGQTSNLYTLKDCAEIWKHEAMVQEDKTEVIAKEYIKALEAMGYNVDGITKTKEKGAAQGDIRKSSHIEQPAKLTHRNNNKKIAKSQEKYSEKYSLNIIKKIYEYNILLEREPLHKDNIDSVINILYDTLNTTKKSIRISSEDKPADVVIGKLLKLKIEDILYAIKQFEKQTNRITNPVGYMLTLLYKAQEQSNLDVQNQVSHDFG